MTSLRAKRAIVFFHCGSSPVLLLVAGVRLFYKELRRSSDVLSIDTGARVKQVVTANHVRLGSERNVNVSPAFRHKSRDISGVSTLIAAGRRPKLLNLRQMLFNTP
jgi:hypothetical protein